ncbi:hypothetical protein Cgig2_026621 [Carnegiea gigantea]|uniref:Uncharacterized protein n=1 Tax=Carnegiea gigantea TaxID=171969 RepID=A0A9Q1JX88_9CARY|nr:hypothetical protein Cgig2_026621 [Carnegiea gigantea]
MAGLISKINPSSMGLLPSCYFPSLKTLIKEMLRKNPKNRPTFWSTVGARAEIDIVSDYGVNYENPPQQNEQNCTAWYVTNMHEQEATRLISNMTKSNCNVKKPNALQNILMEPEVGKPRESMSPTRSNHARVVQRGKIEVSAKVLKPTIIPPIIKPVADSPTIVLVRACVDSARVHASPSLEHQVLD